MYQPSVALIITTYNWPLALKQVLWSVLSQQQLPSRIIIADDGSTEETKATIDQMRPLFSIPLLHVWHPDEGFRAASIRNKAAKKTTDELLVFVDGDCILPPTFIERHVQLAEVGYFVPGQRILFSKEMTENILSAEAPLVEQTFNMVYRQRRHRQVNRCLPALKVPLGFLRRWVRNRWQGAKTCNLAIWRQDFNAVNGFDEGFQGWGYEDSDLVVRLLHHGVKRKLGHWAGLPVMHLWHPEQSRERQAENWQRFQQHLRST